MRRHADPRIGDHPRTTPRCTLYSGDVPTLSTACCPPTTRRHCSSLTRDIATKELAPQVAEMEERAEFPEQAYRLLGRSGLLSLPFPEEHGGGGQPYEVYLQVVEEIGDRVAERRGRHQRPLADRQRGRGQRE